MINIGGNISDIYVGSTKIAEAYIGNELVYSAEPDVIIMTSETNAGMLAICYAQGWAKHSDYMTLKEAQKVTDIGTAFRQKTDLTSLEELKYFTSLTSIATNAFRNNTNLTNGRIHIPEGVTSVGQDLVAYSSTSLTLIFPSTLTSIHSNFRRNCACTVVFQNETIPTISNGAATLGTVQNFTQKYYVPDNSYDEYKAIMPTNMRSSQLLNLSTFVW